MKNILIALALLLLLSYACLELLGYSELTATHTLGIPTNTSRVCYIQMEEPESFDYELESDIPITLIITKGTDITFNQTTGEPITEGVKAVTKVYNTDHYSESIGLGKGTYVLIITDVEEYANVKIRTNMHMECD